MRYSDMTYEASLAAWKCCSSMNDHVEHLDHLRRLEERAETGRTKVWEGIEELIKALQKSIPKVPEEER